MAFSVELLGFLENTSGYSVKRNEGSGSYSASTANYLNDTYTNSCLGWGTSFSSSGSSYYLSTFSGSACETQTSYSESTETFSTYALDGLFNQGPFNTPPQEQQSAGASGSGATARYLKSIKSYGQYGYTYETESSLVINGAGGSTKYSEVASYFTTTDTLGFTSNTVTVWTYRKSITTYNSAGLTSSTYNNQPYGSTAFLYSSGTTTIYQPCTSTRTYEATSFHNNSLFSTSETFEDLETFESSQTFLDINTFYTTDLTLYGTGPKTYSYSVICTYDKTGNHVFTAKTLGGDAIRDSNRDIFLGPQDTASYTKSDIILSFFNSGQTEGYSTSYSLQYNYTYSTPVTLTKTSLLNQIVGYTFSALYPIALYSTSSYTETDTFYGTAKSSGGFTLENTFLTSPNGGFFSTSCKQMVYTTSTHKKFYYLDTLTTSFEMTSYIFTTSGFTYFNNTSFGSQTASGGDSASDYQTTYLSDDCFTYYTTGSGATTWASSSGSSSYSAAQTIGSYLAPLSTRFRHPFNNTDYTSTYYTEALNAGLLINGERKAFWGYSPSSASVCAFVNSQYDFWSTSIFSPLRATQNLFPYSGSFITSNTTINQAYLESPSVTTFSQTLYYSVGTQITTSSRTILYSLTGFSTYATSEQDIMRIDSDAYLVGAGQYPYLFNGVPQLVPQASNILNSFGYFATGGSYFLNDELYVNGSGSAPVVQYVDGSQTFSYPISKNLTSDHGRYTATSVVGGAVVYGNYGTIGGGFFGADIELVFSRLYGM